MSAALTFNFADLLQAVSAAVPERPAVAIGGRQLSYGEFWQRVDAVAVHLHGAGVRTGDRVGVQLANSVEYLESFFAVCRLGAAPVNVNYRYQAEELAYLYGMMDLAAVVHGAAASPAVEAAIGLRGSAAARPLRRVVVGAPARLPGCERYEDAVQGSAASLPGISRSDDDLVMLCTGGTTGRPKGVAWTARDMFFGALGGGGYFHPAGPVSRPGDLSSRVPEMPRLVSFPLAPLMHGAALWSTLSSLFAGQKIVLADTARFDAEEIWGQCERERVNMITIVGDAMALPLVTALEQHPGRWNLGAVSYVGSGGALFSGHLQQRLRHALPHLQIGNSMGSSEGGVLGMGGKPAEGGLIRIPPRPDLAIVIDGRLAAPGEEGTLARSGFVPRGYFGDPVKSAETFVEIAGRRYALTGDTARQEADGSFTVFGRGSNCINTGGEKVFPEEVEEVLLGHPQVRDALVVGIPDDRWGERVTAVVEPRSPGAVTTEALREYCRSHVAGYKVPKDVIFVERVARSVAGKADYGWAKRAMLASLAAR